MAEQRYTIEERQAFPTGTVVVSALGNRWRKRADGLWTVLTDREWGPATSEELPAWLIVLA
jgi:hypothetical protein